MMNRDNFLCRFQLANHANYHPESLLRLQHLTDGQLTPAAVLIPIIERHQQLYVLLTKRATTLRKHPGQISFPGGKFENDDQQLKVTAIRETVEEIGVHASQITIIGAMPPLPTISRFQVTPYLGFLNSNYHPQLDPNEVAEVFEVPLSYLIDPNNLLSQTFRVQNQMHRAFAIPFQHYFIWGVTGQIIACLQQQLNFSSD